MHSDLNSETFAGLDHKQVLENQQKFGFNYISNFQKKSNFFKVFLSQFRDLINLLMVFILILSLSVRIYEIFKLGTDFSTQNVLLKIIEPFIIFFILVTNGIIGTWQYFKSEKAVSDLQNLNRFLVTVKRANRVLKIDAKELTVGDLVLLKPGDVVPADGILLAGNELQVSEATLTGESNPVSKQIVKKNQNIDKKNWLFSSTIILQGTGIIEIKKIGNETEIGKVNRLIQTKKPPLSPMQMQLNKLGKIFTYGGIFLFILVFLIQLFYFDFSNAVFDDYNKALIIAISLAVAAVPEGLITFSTIILALNVKKITKYHLIVKNLTSIETLGKVSVICCDKTGTITENNMKVTASDNFSAKPEIDVLKNVIFCCETEFRSNDLQRKQVGNPTELAILKYAAINFNLYKDQILAQENIKIIKVFPFDSNKKRMSVLIRKNSKYFWLVKGSFIILQKLVQNNSEILQNSYQKMALEGLRVIAFAVREMPANFVFDPLESEKFYDIDLECHFIFGIQDPPRQEVAHLVSETKKAGIKTIMITGDTKNTAIAVAKKVGIYQRNDGVLTGDELENYSDEKLTEKLSKVTVFAQTKPEHKQKIVTLLQKKQEVVLMTGDGINDAPSLKIADVGCAMGKTGTDVSKKVANMILLNENFKTIVKGIERGRSVYDKIKKVIQNLLFSSLAELVAILLGIIIFPIIAKIYNLDSQKIYFMSASQLLIINLLTHGFPAIALGITESRQNFLNYLPVAKNESIFAKKMGKNLLFQGFLVGILSLFIYGLFFMFLIREKNMPIEKIVKICSSVSFFTMGISAPLNSLNLIENKSIFAFSWKHNKWVYISVLFSIFMVAFFTFTPKLNQVFQLENFFEIKVPSYFLFLVFCFCFVIIFVCEIQKIWDDKKIRKLE